ncbi:MAG: glyoxalase/bleomycin resistance/extradiol dioxygenase family protein [bacterium]
MQMSTYLTFKGECGAALTLYERSLGGILGPLFRYAGTELANKVPADWQDKIMRGSITIGGQVLIGPDITPDKFEVPKGFSLSLQFTALKGPSASFTTWRRGTVVMPLEKTFWAARFGVVVDRLGIQWLINCDGSEQTP